MATEAWILEKATIGEGDEIANSLAARMLIMQAALGGTSGHIPLFTGTVYYADAAQADNTGAGTSPDTAKRDLSAALALCSAGDAVTVKAGTYDEVGLALTLTGMELWAEIGTVLQDTAGGTVLTVSGNSCRVCCDMRILPTGAVGISVTGQACIIENVRVFGATTAFDIQGSGTQLRNVGAATPTVTGFDFRASQVTVDMARTAGINGATRGYWIRNGADYIRLWSCESTSHGTAGFEIDSGSNYCMIRDCASGAGDGKRIDDGFLNMWANFADSLPDEHHEEIYPASEGEGVAGAPVTVNNSTTDGVGGLRQDQDYWGDVVTLVPLSTITDRFKSLGLYVFAVTAADIQQWQMFFIRTAYGSAQDGGQDWDENETVLTVADGTIFEDDDWVWITGTDRANGEILKVSGAPAGNVVTIARETTADGEAGLRYDYDVAPGANMMYVASRDDAAFLHWIAGIYSASGAREFDRVVWHTPREMPGDTGILMRMLNGTDGGASSFEATAVYED